MSSIWPTKKLGEISKENIKSSFKVEDANNSGIFPFFTSGEDILTHSENLVDGENLFLSTGGYFHIKYYNGKAGYSSDTWSLRAKDGLTKYVYYQILAKLKFIDSLFFRGSGLRHLQKQEFLNIQIPLPPPPEQQKIVYVLDTIQEAIGAQEKIIEKTKELKRAMMNLLFHYGTAILKIKEFASLRVGELTSEEFEKLTGQKLKKTEIGEIPESWEVVKLEEVVKARKEQVRPKENDRYVGLEHIESGEISIKRFGRGKEVRSLKNKFYPNDILYGKLRPYLDKVVISTFEGVVSTDLIIFKPNLKKIFPLFLVNLLHTSRFLNFAIATTTGTNHPRTSWEVLKNFKLSLPPLPEQREIAEILQTIDQKIETEEKKKALYEELFKAMLDKLMTGEIRVNDIDL